jgi:hypothetical protein
MSGNEQGLAQLNIGQSSSLDSQRSNCLSFYGLQEPNLWSSPCVFHAEDCCAKPVDAAQIQLGDRE